MTHEQKINYMRIAAGMAGLGFSKEQLDLLTSLYDMILEKEGKSTVDDAVAIEMEVKKRDEERQKEELKAKKK